MQTTSPQGRDFIRGWEGTILHAYDDADPLKRFIERGMPVRGVLTIGTGHTKTVIPGMRIDAAEADRLLTLDLADAEGDIRFLVKRKLAQHQFDALAAFVFNVGGYAFRQSTSLRRLNDGDLDGAAEALTWYNKQTIKGVLVPNFGLTKRRRAERALFLHADYSGRP